MKNYYALKHHACDLTKVSMSFLPSLPPNAIYWKRFKKWLLEYLVIAPNNPGTRKYFRSLASIGFERKRQVALKYPYIIHPYCKARVAWQLIMFVMTLITVVTVPYNVAFRNTDVWKEEERKEEETELDVYYWAMISSEIFCILDIIVHFCTGYRNPLTKQIILDFKVIAIKYLQTSFLIDLITAAPWYLTSIFFLQKAQVGETESIASFSLEMVSLVKMYRLVYARDILYQLLEHTELSVVLKTAFRQFMTITITLHCVSCTMYYVPTVLQSVDPKANADSWTVLYQAPPFNADVTPFKKYLMCLYIGSSFFLGAATGPSRLTNIPDMITVVIVIISGKLFTMYIFVIFLKLVLNYDNPHIKYEEIIMEMKQYMASKHLPLHFQRRLLMYFEYRFPKTYFNENMILSNLSDHLGKEVKVHDCKRLIKNVQIFKSLPKPVIGSILSCLKRDIFLPNDIIMKANTIGTRMYFISAGTVGVYTENGQEISHLKDGDYFGEIAMLAKNAKRCVTVVALEVCDVYYLRYADFQMLILPHEELLAEMKRVSLYRIRETEKYI